MMTYWFSYDSTTGAGVGRGVAVVPLDLVSQADPLRSFIEITPEEYASIDRADHFRVDGGKLVRKTEVTLSANAASAPTSESIAVSWTPTVEAEVHVNYSSVGTHAGTVELTSSVPSRFLVQVMDPHYFSEPIYITFEDVSNG
jgi:hypothetical protein